MKDPKDFTPEEAKFAAECMNFAAIADGCDGPLMEAEYVADVKPHYIEEALHFSRSSGALNFDGQTLADALIAS